MRSIGGRQAGKQAIGVGMIRTLLEKQVEDSESGALRMRLQPQSDREQDAPELEALWRRVTGLAHRVIDLHDDYPDEWKTFVSGIPSAGLMADVVGSTLPLPPEEKIALLESTDPAERLERIARHLEREVTIAETQRALSKDADSEVMDPERRRRLLRRQMRDIEADPGAATGIRELGELRERLAAAGLPAAALTPPARRLARLSPRPQPAPAAPSRGGGSNTTL